MVICAGGCYVGFSARSYFECAIVEVGFALVVVLGFWWCLLC